MTIKTFRARTLRDALAMVRAEFGPGAAVLHSRELNTGPISRLWRGRVVEVAATPDRSPLAEQAELSGAVAAPAARNRVSKPLQELGELVSTLAPPTAAVASTKPRVEPLVHVCSRLIEADVTPELARSLVRSAADTLPASEQASLERFGRGVVDAFQDRLAVSGPIRTDGPGCRVVALVGATGVGKTTTLAKLAANFRLRDGVRVGLITVDTYRVAAVDQLRTYAEIIDLPMEVVATPAEMRAAVAKLAGLDLVLIDTAGRSPRDDARIEELRTLLAEAAPHETHLVASVTSTPRALRETVERFAAVQPTSLLLTKLDEAPMLGHVAAPVVDAGLPISYLTDGQSVPEDIRVAELTSLAERLLAKEVA